MLNQRTQGILLIFSAAFLFSTIGAVFKFLQLPGTTVLFYRSIVAALFLLVILKFVLKKPVYWPKSWVEWGVSFSYAGVCICFILANQFTTAANAIFLQYISPIIVFVLSVLFLRERIKVINVLALVISMTGVALFFLEKGSIQEFWGNVLGISSGLLLGIYTTLLGYKKSDQGFYLIMWGIFLTALMVLPFVPQFTISGLQWGILLYLGCFQIALPNLLFNKALQKISAQEVSLFALLEPVLNPIWAFFFVQERPSPYAIAGGILILGALVTKILLDRKGS